MKYLYSLTLLLLAILSLTSCLYEAPPSKPTSQIDTWLLGQWITQDKSGKIFQAVITPIDNIHYQVTFSDQDQANAHPWEFEGWISRVGNIKFLTLRALTANPRYHNKYLFLHYELITPEKNPENSLPKRCMRISEPQLTTSELHLDSYHLRQVITKKINAGTLLIPPNASQGFSIWTREGGNITWPKSKI
jgi:hypothetical protein